MLLQQHFEASAEVGNSLDSSFVFSGLRGFILFCYKTGGFIFLRTTSLLDRNRYETRFLVDMSWLVVSSMCVSTDTFHFCSVQVQAPT